ncbi:hypothetical protein [Microcystis phage MaeS]|nr:hypothetical protein [Microcystis phage MaeS]
MCYEEDFYEPSEFEIMFAQMKDALLNSVKEEYIAEMVAIKKENQELQEIKKNFEALKRDFNNKKRELEMEYQTLKSNVRRERLSQLMKDMQVELYSVASKSRKCPKCDKCDENRRLYYKTPSGKDAYESCDCDVSVSEFQPVAAIMNTFSIRDGKGHAWYKIRDEGRHDEYLYHYDDSISGSELVVSEDQFKEIGYAYRTLFKDKEIAQKFCDYKNKQENEKERKHGAKTPRKVK